MKWLASLTVAILMASSFAIARAKPPIDCVIAVRIDAAGMPSTAARAHCEFGGRIYLIVDNKGNATDYAVTFEKFRYKGTSAATAAKCDKTLTTYDDVPHAHAAGVKSHTVNIPKDDVRVFGPRVFNNRRFKSECFKYDITVNPGGKTLDPDLEVTDPPPPPPPPPPTTPVKPKQP